MLIGRCQRYRLIGLHVNVILESIGIDGHGEQTDQFPVLEHFAFLGAIRLEDKANRVAILGAHGVNSAADGTTLLVKLVEQDVDYEGHRAQRGMDIGHRALAGLQAKDGLLSSARNAEVALLMQSQPLAILAGYAAP